MDVYSSVSSIFYLSRASGLSPFNLIGTIGRREFKESFIIFTYSCLVFSILTSGFLYVVIFERTIMNSNSGLTNIVNTFQFTSDYILVTISILSSWFNREKFIRFYSVLNHIDTSLELIKSYHYKRCKYLAIAQITITLFIFISAILLLALSQGIGILSIFWADYYVTKFVNCVMIVQFSSCVFILKLRFKLVNSVMLQHLGPYYNINSEKYNLFNSKNIITKNSCVKLKLKYLRASHDCLCDLSKDINDVYSPALLTFVTAAFVHIMTECHYIVGPSFYHSTRLVFILSSAFNIAIIGYHVVLIAVTCSALSEEANYTSILVHKMLLLQDDTDVKEELLMFSSQLLHRKHQITCWGFFPVDVTLLYSIAAGVTTYLIILIQFQSTHNMKTTLNQTLASNYTV